MNPNPLTIQVTGLSQATDELQNIRGALASRSQLHAAIASKAEQFTEDYLRGSSNHKTAQRLGAKPTGFRARNSRSIESASNEETAIVRIPRSTGLGRAFSDITIKPSNGRTYLTIPACAETYGRVVREFPADAFKFAMFQGAKPCVALLWAEDGGSHRKGDVAWWLRREVTQKQDRGLLPSDEGYQGVARDRALEYIESLKNRGK